MELDHELDPEVVEMLQGISVAVTTLWDVTREWYAALVAEVETGELADRCGNAAIDLWSYLFSSMQFIGGLPQCPERIWRLLLEAQVLTTWCRELRERAMGLRERIISGENVKDWEETGLSLVWQTQELIIRFRLAMRIAGLDLPLVSTLGSSTAE